IKAADAPGDGGLRLRYSAVMQGLRDAIDARIRNVLEGDKRAIATALLTGRRDAISEPVNDAMFISGLGHVLSISGYHMAVVAGVVFFAVRALLALIPALTVSFAIKKWSAVAALLAAAFYLLLSGAEVATQRSFFMTAVVLIAVMVDRRAVTFRTLAVAAMIVLTIAPEALVHPSFQMSFAATLGLVALVQIGMPRLFASPDNPATARVALWGGRDIATLVLAALVAAVVWALAVPQPDVLVSGDAHNVGVRGKDGRLHLMRTAKDAFLLKEWLAADADGRQPADASLAEGVSCDEAGCVMQMADGAFVALALRPDALTDDCERAALVVTTRQASPSCPAPVIGQDRLRSQGPIALRRTRTGFAVDAVRPRGVDRPWSPVVAGGTECEAILAPRCAIPPPADATLANADHQ